MKNISNINNYVEANLLCIFLRNNILVNFFIVIIFQSPLGMTCNIVVILSLGQREEISAETVDGESVFILRKRVIRIMTGLDILWFW